MNFQRYWVPTFVDGGLANYFPQKLHDEVKRIARITQAPWDLAAVSTLSAISTVCSPLINVKSPMGNVCSTGTFFLVFADSGVGKTRVDHESSTPTLEGDDACLQEFPALIAALERDQAIWTATRKVLEKKLTDSIKSSGLDVEAHNVLKMHDDKKPKPPRLLKTHWSVKSVPAFWKALERSGQCIALTSDEGGTVIDRDFIELIPYLCKAWDGRVMMPDSANQQSVAVNDPRVTLSILIQRGVWQRYRKKYGDILRDNGFLARCLVLQVKSNTGYRIFEDRRHHQPDLLEFHDRMRELIKLKSDRDQKGRIVLEFDDYARIRWFNYANELEQLTQPGQYLHDAPDVTPKAMENITRIAAQLHFFSGQDGLITVESLERAYLIVWHFIHHFKATIAIPKDVYDAQALERYLHEQFVLYQKIFIEQTSILQCGPECVREAKALHAAVIRLVSENKITVVIGKNRARLINLNCGYFASLPRWAA